MNRKVLDEDQLFFYYIFFYILWILRELWIQDTLVHTNLNLYAIIIFFIKILLWIIPVYLIIKFYLKEDVLSYLDLTKEKLYGMKNGIIIGGIYLIIEILKYSLTQKSMITFSFNLDELLNIFIMAALAEEIVFRGFLFNQFRAKMNFWKSNVLTSVLFLLIHYPSWIYNGTSMNIFVQVQVFLLSMIFGYIYDIMGSLWTVITMHFFYNFTITIIK